MKKSRVFSAVFISITCLVIISALAIVISGQPKRPARSYIELTPDGAWCWFADPRAVYHEGRHKRIYAGWVNKSGDIKIGYYDKVTKKIGIATLKKGFQRNDHANPAILIRKDGRIMVFYSAHNGGAMFYRVSRAPEDISSWGKEISIATNTAGKSGYTYPNVFQLTNEDNKIYLFWRGGNWKPSFAESKDGIQWSAAKTFIQGGGQRPYVKYASNNVGTIHFAFTDGHPDIESRNNIYYACYRDGAFYKADGSMIKNVKDLPLAPSETDKVYDAAVFGARAWIWDIAFERAGNPVIVYVIFPRETEHVYRYACWNGKAWENHDIVLAGGWFPQTPKGGQEREKYYSGGIVLDHSNPSIVYLSRSIRGVFEIEKWATSDHGYTWNSEKITSDSDKNNIRPVVPINKKADGAEVIWMYGDYIYYTDYSTSLRIKTR